MCLYLFIYVQKECPIKKNCDESAYFKVLFEFCDGNKINPGIGKLTSLQTDAFESSQEMIAYKAEKPLGFILKMVKAGAHKDSDGDDENNDDKSGDYGDGPPKDADGDDENNDDEDGHPRTRR